MQIIVSIFAVLGGLLCIYEAYRILKQRLIEWKIFTWAEVDRDSKKLFDNIMESKYEPDMIIGLGRGGTIVAGIVAAHFRESPVCEFKMIPIASIDRFYILENDQRKDVIITGFHNIDVQGKKLLVLNADTYSGTTLNRAREVLLWDYPDEVRTGSLFLFMRHRQKPAYEPHFYGKKLSVRKSDKRVPWRGEEYRFEDEHDLESLNSVLVVLHGLVATGKTSVTDAIVKHLGYIPIYSDWYWFKYGLHNRHKDRSVSQKHYKHMLGKCWSVIGNRSHAILDCTSRWKSFRNEIIEDFSQRGVTVIFVRCQCSESSAYERINKRQFIGPYDFGTKFEYERVKQDYDQIDADELSQINLIHVDTDKLTCSIESNLDIKAKKEMDTISKGIEKFYIAKIRNKLEKGS